MLDLIIRGGQVLSETGQARMDIGIKAGQVVQLGMEEYMPQAHQVWDASMKLVLPGLVDPHTHFALPFMDSLTAADFARGTQAAAVGGTTAVIDFAIQRKGDLPSQALARRRQEADGQVAVDYALHLVITDASREAVGELRDIIREGVPSFKCFMTYLKQGIMSDDGVIMAVLEQVKEEGLWGAHAENSPIYEYLVERALEEGNTSAIYHALTRPPLVEAEAINRALFLTDHAQSAFYDFHLSIGQGVEMIERERSRGRPVYAETCTHYLTLTVDRLNGEEGINYICSPPLRSEDHLQALWEGLRSGAISTVASDECTFTRKQKRVGQHSFVEVPNGLPGMEFRLPLIYTEGVVRGRISPERMVEVLSTNSARIFGLHPRKGTIAVGSDADLVVFDPRKEKTLTAEDSATGCDWHPYEGMTVRGWPLDLTVVKGQVAAREGKFCGDPQAGSFLKRQIPREVLERPVV